MWGKGGGWNAWILPGIGPYEFTKYMVAFKVFFKKIRGENNLKRLAAACLYDLV